MTGRNHLGYKYRQPAKDVSDIKMYVTSEFMRLVYECRSLPSYRKFNRIVILSMMVSDLCSL